MAPGDHKCVPGPFLVHGQMLQPYLALMAVICQCWQGTCERQESSSIPTPALASSLPGSCTAWDAAARPLQSLPSLHALASVPKMPFFLLHCDCKGKAGVSTGDREGVSQPGLFLWGTSAPVSRMVPDHILYALHSLQAAMYFTAH